MQSLKTEFHHSVGWWDDIKDHLPLDGEVRVMKITDKQFGRIEIFFGKLSQPVENPPEQLEFF